MIKKMLKCSWLIIALCAAITVFFGWQLRTIKIENTSRTFMPKDDDSYKLMLKTEDTFGSMLMLGISLETKGATILTPEYINVVKKITDRIESVNYVENIDSISNIDFIHGEISEDGEGTLKASSLLGDDDAYSFTADGMKTIKQEIIDWQEMYNRVIVNDDFKATQMMVTITASTEDGEELPSDIQNKILAEIKGICEEELDGSDLEVRYFGDPVMSHDAREFLMSDLINLIPFVALIVLFSLYFSFHTWSGTLLPLITVLISTVWSVGLLCLLDFSFTIIGSMIPVCLIACGSAYGIHVMTHYYIGLDKIEGEITKENHAGAIEFALKDVWIAVLLAAVTTVAGFISNVSSPLRPLRSFSIFAAAGVAFALILSITLIPALLYVTPVKVVGKHWKNKNRLSTKIRRRLEHELARRGGKSKDEANASTLYSIYHFFAGTKPRLVILVLVILFLSSIGLKLLVVDTAMVNYFPRTSKFRQDLAYVDETLSGSNSMYIVIKGKEIENSAQSEEEALDLGEFDFSEFEEPALGTELESVTESSSDSDFGDFDFSSFDEPASSSENTADAEPVKQYYSLTDPEILRAVDDLQNYLAAKHPEIGKVVSFTTFIKRMNQVMHVPVAGTSGVESESADILDSPAKVKDILEMMNRAYAAAGGEKASANAVVRELERELNYNGLAYYEIPYDIEKYSVDRRENLSNLVTQYLYLLSSDAITRFADDMTNPKAIRTQVQLRTHSTVDTGLLINDINDYVAKYFPTDKYTVETTGSAALENTMSHLVIDSQMVSIVFSLVMVFIIIALSFKSGWAGLIGAIPLGLVILLNFMVMGFMGIRLDLCTSIVSSIAIGVGIDYTIHFMETYQHEREKSNDSESVTKATFKSSGKGIVTNAIAVGLGFLVLVFSKFIILRYIGILVAVVMFTSSMLAMTIIPGLLNAFDPKFMWSKDEKEAYKAKIEAEKK
ncbi:MAG: RND family transporter [Treponema sp.]|uniref:efflux RND transporter permease subunit n=1 Tax=Treponema sp. TaxID=166 RepID=UPI0025CFFF51|nr:MMPL family transporter [Treponema sp.]MBQ8681109.1 RND family transporter [Treponema sp.]